MLKSAALREFLVVLALCVASFVFAARFDLFEAFERWSAAHENLNVDEFVVVAVVGFPGLLVYSWRRYRQAQEETRQLSRTERAFAETTEHYRSLFDYNPHAVFSVDLLGCFSASNASSELLCGYTTVELSAMDVGALILPSHATGTAAAFEQAINRKPQQVETAFRHKDGHLVEVNVTGLPIVVDDEVVGVYCIAEDITERKQMERTLLRTQVAAEEANEAKSLFLDNVSHEIRTPLTTLLGTNEVLMDTDLDPLQTRFTETMRRSGERLLALVNDILDFSKMEAGQGRAKEGALDVRVVMADMAKLFTSVADLKGLDFELTVDQGLPPTLIGDPCRLAQLLTNLLDNAVKFTEEGRVRASATVAGTKSGSMDVRFVVEDSGIGICQEHQGRLFDSFSQADASITRKYSGTGLGLAICKQVVQLMGGSIGVRSTLGEGCVLTVVLPFALPCPHDDEGVPSSAVTRRGSTLEK